MSKNPNRCQTVSAFAFAVPSGLASPYPCSAFRGRGTRRSRRSSGKPSKNAYRLYKTNPFHWTMKGGRNLRHLTYFPFALRASSPAAKTMAGTCAALPLLPHSYSWFGIEFSSLTNLSISASEKPFSLAASSSVPQIGSPQRIHLIPCLLRYDTDSGISLINSSMVIVFKIAIRQIYHLRPYAQTKKNAGINSRRLNIFLPSGSFKDCLLQVGHHQSIQLGLNQIQLRRPFSFIEVIHVLARRLNQVGRGQILESLIGDFKKNDTIPQRSPGNPPDQHSLFQNFVFLDILILHRNLPSVAGIEYIYYTRLLKPGSIKILDIMGICS